MLRRLWTIGHSNHSLGGFAALLAQHRIERVCDVRTVPKSRRHAHFWAEALAETLPARGIEYRHLPRLGGWRRPRPDSPNTAWRVASFQGYADYALTSEFAGALSELCELAASWRTAIMCSEALWWRCHRRLVADRLVASGWEVCHIAADGRATGHSLPEFAGVQGDGTLLYR